MTDDQETAAAMRHVLSIASVTARHAMTRLPIADADRPLRIAQYADRALQDLAHISASPNTYQQLQLVTSVHRTPSTDRPDDRLEAALEDWTHAVRAELRHPIPSSDVLHNIMTTGVHILATTEAIHHVHRERSTPENTLPVVSSQMRATVLALQAAATAWRPVTTARTPSARYVAAARDAFSALNATQSNLSSGSSIEDVDIERCRRNLYFATRSLSAHMAAIDGLTRQLLDSSCCSSGPAPSSHEPRSFASEPPAGSYPPGTRTFPGWSTPPTKRAHTRQPSSPCSRTWSHGHPDLSRRTSPWAPAVCASRTSAGQIVTRHPVTSRQTFSSQTEGTPCRNLSIQPGGVRVPICSGDTAPAIAMASSEDHAPPRLARP